jgi:hypothetical protein
LRSLLLALTVFSTYAFPQQRDFQLEGFASAEASTQSSDDQQSSKGNHQQQTGNQQEKTPPGVPAISGNTKKSNAITPSGEVIPPSKQQPKRILGVMPNYRAISAGATPSLPTPREAFKIASQNSFDYSAFVFVGITSLIAEGGNKHPQLGKGLPGFWAYYWRGYVDKTDGNYLVIFALPTILHQDERYYALGKGPIWKRAVYSASRVVITPDYHGRNSFNASELVGRGIAQAISTTYYPSHDRTVSEVASKWAYAIMRDALTNTFREFWPDIAVHVLHRHP